MNPTLRVLLWRSALTLGFFLLLVPVHELGHLLVDFAEGVTVASYSLLSLQPSVVTTEPMTAEAFLAGPLLSMAIVLAVWYHFRSPEWKPYFVALIITLIVGDFVDFNNVFLLITSK